jgi:small-conductance mechanosensitive channel
MLDPLTALSLVGNVVQFIDFGTKLLAKGHELYNSADGAALGHTELISIAKDLQELNGRLNEALSSEQIEHKRLTDSDVALCKLSEQCSGVAGELAEALDKLSAQGTSHRRWKSFRQALKSMMKREEVDAITTRLQHLCDELNLHLLVSMKYALETVPSHSANLS